MWQFETDSNESMYSYYFLFIVTPFQCPTAGIKSSFLGNPCGRSSDLVEERFILVWTSLTIIASPVGDDDRRKRKVTFLRFAVPGLRARFPPSVGQRDENPPVESQSGIVVVIRGALRRPFRFHFSPSRSWLN